MSGSAHVRVAESDNGLVLILITGTIGIGLRLVFAETVYQHARIRICFTLMVKQEHHQMLLPYVDKIGVFLLIIGMRWLRMATHGGVDDCNIPVNILMPIV